jgi:hypothetical protein
MVGLGIDTGGQKQVLGFWQEATENHELREELELVAASDSKGGIYNEKGLSQCPFKNWTSLAKQISRTSSRILNTTSSR